MYGHLIGTGLYAFDIPEFISGTLEHPLLQGGGIGNADFLGQILYYKFHTEAATFGVNMFFMCTGFLIPGMLQRYNRKQFSINRFFRLIPVLAICELLIITIVRLSQGIVYTPVQYIATVFVVTIQLFKIVATTGVIWTLIIEVVFYFACLILGKINKASVVLLLVVDVLLNMLTYEYEFKHFENLAFDFRFIGIICIDCMAYLNKDEKDRICATAEVMFVTLVNVYVFNYAKVTLGVTTTYTNISTVLLPTLLFLVLLEIDRKGKMDKVPIIKPAQIIIDSCYPLYLTHVCVGLTTMYWLSRAGINPWLNLLICFVLCVAVAWAIEAFFEKPIVKFSRGLIKRAG